MGHVITRMPIAPIATPPFPPGVPAEWNGISWGERSRARWKFPCIGRCCVERGATHWPGTRFQPFRDVNIDGAQQWQRMCISCVESSLMEQELARVDEHSLSLFPWDDATLDADLAEQLDGPCLFPAAAAPRNPLPPIKAVSESDAEWEPLGFNYLRYLARKQGELDIEAAAAVAAGEAAMVAEAPGEAAMVAEDEESEAEEVDEAQLDSPISLAWLHAAAEAAAAAAATTAAALTAAAHQPDPATPPRSQGGARWSSAGKAKARTIASNTPIKPARPGELQFMSEALSEAREANTADSDEMYSRAVKLYCRRVEQYFSNRSAAIDVRWLRPNPTSAELLKGLQQGNLRFAMRIEQERVLGGSSADPILALPAPAAPPPPPPAIALPVADAASPTAATPPTAATSTAATALTGTTTVDAFDFSGALPQSHKEISKAKKKKRSATYVSKHNGMGVTVRRHQLRGAGQVNYLILTRLARHPDLMISVKRETGGRSWEDIRKEVEEQWPWGDGGVHLEGV